MDELNKIYHGDCLEWMKEIETGSINLVVIDPPYNIGKDKRWDKIDNYVDWMTMIFKECERVLKPNGSFYWFHNDMSQVKDLMTSLENETSFVYKQLITWNKTNFKRYAWKNRNPEKCKDRNWFPNVEYCLFYTFQDETGRKMVDYDLNNYRTLRNYSKEFKDFIGLGLKEINKRLGHRRAEHFFYWNTQQFSLPTPETYNELVREFGLSNWDDLKEYEELRQEYEGLRQEYEELRQEYEKERYTFNLEEVQENISCVWEDAEINHGKYHPTQKPLATVEKIIRTSSNEGDIVLDCFMGSGTTAIAALNTGRNFIGIEKEWEYCEIANKRIEEWKACNTIN